MASDESGMPRASALHTHMTRRTALMGMGAAGLIATFSAHGVHAAEAGNAAYHKLTITAKDYAYELPATTPGGYTEITLQNKGSEEHHAMFMRLNPGRTTAEFMTAAREKDLGALFAISSSAGGPGSVDQGRSSTVIVDLTPGEYVVICIVPDAKGMPHYKMGMLAPLTVTAATGTGRSPAAEATIDLVDFAFNDLPRQIRGGKHLWKVLDTSAQLHEMIINRLAPGVSFKQAQAMLMAPLGTGAAPAASAPPFVALAGVAPMSPAAANWAMLDLKDGDYFAICFVPDIKTGKPHFELGMIAPLAVRS